jgi:SAM-dependent methyltransferase
LTGAAGRAGIGTRMDWVAVTQTAPWHGPVAYERYMGRWSRQLAPRFVQWLHALPGQRWLDVGCGTGALSAAILASCAPSTVTGVDPSEGFLAAARDNLPAHVCLHCARADHMPLADAEVDVVASALVLNFVPDAAAALREMVRVSADGGRVAACVWDYAQGMQMIRHYWDAAAQLALLAPGQAQGERCPEAIAEAFADAGLQQVEGTALEIDMHFADFDDFWQPFLGGQGPAPAHAVGLPDADRARLREALRAQVPARADGSIRLQARAWAARAVVRR